VEAIRQLNRYAAVLNTYMEEAPLISDWAKLTQTPHVVVVPFFIADGLHSYEDIPVLLGIEAAPAGSASERQRAGEVFATIRIRCMAARFTMRARSEPMRASLM
jgi:sirohydrochlorin ferrochelatase